MAGCFKNEKEKRGIRGRTQNGMSFPQGILKDLNPFDNSQAAERQGRREQSTWRAYIDRKGLGGREPYSHLLPCPQGGGSSNIQGGGDTWAPRLTFPVKPEASITTAPIDLICDLAHSLEHVQLFVALSGVVVENSRLASADAETKKACGKRGLKTARR
jgi:hypothetical protein